jgi:hypothetical protein
LRTSVELIKFHPKADLALMDIELADGQSFEIFNQVTVKFPVYLPLLTMNLLQKPSKLTALIIC